MYRSYKLGVFMFTVQAVSLVAYVGVKSALADDAPQPAAGPSAVAAPRPPPLVGTGSGTNARYSCVLGDHGGVDSDEARTATDVVCTELAKQNALAGEYEVRFGKLGSTLIVTLVQRSTGTERQVVISGMDEMLVAAPRLVAELTKSTSAGVSPSVDNVTAPETRTSLHKATSAGFSMGLLGATAVGVDPGFSGGVSLHLGFRMGQAGVALDGRAGGIGSGDNKLVLTDVGVGGRYYITNADMTPFVAGGVALSYFGADRGNNPALSGSGLGAYAEIGFEGFRTSRTGFIASVRADFPFFSLNSSNDGLYYYNYTGTAVTPPPTVSTYVVPVTLDVGIVFN